MTNELSLIIGASGQIGSEVVKLLRAGGHRVRTATSRAATGPDSVHLNLATGEGLEKAFEGVNRAFLLAPPPHADQYKILSPLIQEAKRRGLKKVVLMTALGANAVETSPFRRVEIELEQSGLNYNIIRPNWFMQNFATFWVHSIQAQGKIFLPAGTAKTSFIDTHDIGAVVAKLLVSDEMNNKAFDLTGPEALDHNQIATAISEATGRKITYTDIPPADLKKGLVGAGLPDDYADFLLMIFGFLKQGYNAGVNGNVKTILGRDPRPFAKVAKESREAWI
jgi:uncharacterized protein YbjT (DUF2867 family)